MITRRIVRALDTRLGTARFTRHAVDKAFPDNWSFMLGEIAMYSFIVLVMTGIFLTFFFDPGTNQVVYHGSYRQLDGVKMSEAYRSVVHMSFDVRAGLVMRQMHHWAALVFVGAIVVHLCRIFFTGAFRRPRELNWFVGITLLLLALLNGFTGYSLPDDLLSGTGLRIAYSIVLSVPIVGEWAAFLLFGGEFPANNINSRLFVIHVMIVPAAITALLAVHLAILWRQKHTHFPGPGRRERNVVGLRLWPSYAAKSLALFSLVVAVTGALGGIAQINPVWLYGPFEPAAVSTAAQPDWYVGWLEGALRLAGPWRVHVFGRTISEVFWPAVLLPTIVFLLLYAWPFLERALTGDGAEHHLLDRPRDHPVRTAFGIATLSFFVVLTLAGAQDIVAQQLDAPIRTVNGVLRVLVFVTPVVCGLLAWKWARDLRAGESLEVWAAKGEAYAGPTEAPVEADLVKADAGGRPVAAAATTDRGWVRRTADAVVGTVLVAVLVRAGRGRGGGNQRPPRDGSQAGPGTKNG
jgi:ubiquinol-cytochrome c reductase cytochrome b subunit